MTQLDHRKEKSLCKSEAFFFLTTISISTKITDAFNLIHIQPRKSFRLVKLEFYHPYQAYCTFEIKSVVLSAKS